MVQRHNPAKVGMLGKGLLSHPNRQFANYVCNGIRDGFGVGFNYRRSVVKQSSGNMCSIAEHGDVVEEYLQKELAAGRILGPYTTDQFPDVHVSPFGVIPKSDPGKWRLIVDLSAPKGRSVNDSISKELCSLSYLSVDQVAAKVIKMGVGSLLAKFDLQAAYRNVPVHPDDRHLLGLRWGENVFLDTALPFGLRSAPMIFTAVADALAFIMRSRIPSWLDHYLDDFVLVGPPGSVQCGQDLQTALDTCAEVGFPVSEGKTFGPATTITLLGIELDAVASELRLPREKLMKLRKMVARWRTRKACTKRELQSLAGHLNHACKVVRPGRRFLRGLFGLISQFGRRDHMIRLSSSFRADLEWWHVFVASCNGVSLLKGRRSSEWRVEIWSDASGSWGCGAVWGVCWIQFSWESCPSFASASIAPKELLPIIMAVAMWGHLWPGAEVLCHCDNMSVVAAINGGYCRDLAMAHMFRCLFFLEAKYDLTLSVVHVPWVENQLADAISRNKLDSFFDLFPQAQRQPSPLFPGLVEHLVRQEPWTSAVWSSWLDSLSMPR